jgi:hypothetical protein
MKMKENVTSNNRRSISSIVWWSVTENGFPNLSIRNFFSKTF